MTQHDHASMAEPAGISFLDTIFETGIFTPHGHCYLWIPELVWTHAISDFLIGAAYVGISLLLYYLVRRVRLPFSPMILAFGVFIGACGGTHFMEVWNVWRTDYWVSAAVKIVTAIASVATAVLLVPVRSRVVAVANAAAISEERRLQLEAKNAELEKLYEQIKGLNAARTAFFANVSHELRTPLSLILGPVERMMADPSASESIKRDLASVDRNARLLLQQVNALLDAAKLEASEMRLELADLDLARLVRVVAGGFESLALDRKIHLSVDAPATLRLAADPEKLQRVLLNLLSNAFKYTPEHGRVRLSVEQEGDRVILQVADNGPGIPPEWREQVFERFRQVEEASARRQGGTGLGLAIARDFVDLHHGRITIQDSPGGGALFRVELPLRAPGTPAQPPQAAEEVRAKQEAERTAETLRPPETAEPRQVAPKPNAPLVLLVEDNPEMRSYIAESLSADFEVHTAQDGKEGLARAEALRPDVLVTDVMMPHLTGDQLVLELRKRRELDATSVIVLTARDEDELRLQMLRAGAQDVLRKPFSSEELKARVGTISRTARARRLLQSELATRTSDVDTLAFELAERNRSLQAAMEAARAAREQAERASAVKTTFLGLVSHEFRTPLTTIQLNADAIDRNRDPQTLRVGLSRIRQATRRLLGLIESLLEYTRIESGRLIVSPEAIDLTEMATEAAEELLPQAQHKLLTLELDAPGTEPLRTDPRLVRLIILNLLTNAVKFTDKGKVVLRVGQQQDRHFIEVTDTGPGIPVDKQAEVFEPFFQGDELRHKTTPGVGLGLALVRQMAEALGAEVEVESAPEGGTTFRVLLPSQGATGH